MEANMGISCALTVKLRDFCNSHVIIKMYVWGSYAENKAIPAA